MSILHYFQPFSVRDFGRAFLRFCSNFINLSNGIITKWQKQRQVWKKVVWKKKRIISFVGKIKLFTEIVYAWKKRQGNFRVVSSYNVVIFRARRVMKHYYAPLFIWKSDTANHNNSINSVLSSKVKACFTSIFYEHTRHRVAHIIINLLVSNHNAESMLKCWSCLWKVFPSVKV